MGIIVIQIIKITYLPPAFSGFFVTGNCFQVTFTAHRFFMIQIPACDGWMDASIALFVSSVVIGTAVLRLHAR